MSVGGTLASKAVAGHEARKCRVGVPICRGSILAE